MTILQAVNGPATGFAEIRVRQDEAGGEGEWQRVDAESAGLLPYDSHVLKFRLPALPAGVRVDYRVSATAIDFQNAYKIVRGETESSSQRTFRTLAPQRATTRFAIWNDTHENQETIAALHHRTLDAAPDFVLWNGDQTNDVYDEAKMANQYLCPGGLAIADQWPLAYARGNHDVRGPAARSLSKFTGGAGRSILLRLPQRARRRAGDGYGRRQARRPSRLRRTCRVRGHAATAGGVAAGSDAGRLVPRGPARRSSAATFRCGGRIANPTVRPGRTASPAARRGSSRSSMRA